MTEQMANFLKSDLKEAVEKNDKERIDHTMARAMGELVDCQFKTSERVKSLFETSEKHKEKLDRDCKELKEINETVKQLAEERKLAKAKLEGAQMLWKCLKWTCALGGGAGAGYVMKAMTAVN